MSLGHFSEKLPSASKGCVEVANDFDQRSW